MAAVSGSAQQLTTRFYENFDTVPHQMVNSHTLTGPVANWNDTTALWVSPSHSYHANVVVGDTLFTRTFAFSTQGARYVKLTFDHIAKFGFMQRGTVQVSVDNGATWTQLSTTHYEGESNFNVLGYFNEYSYINPSKPIYWGGLNGITPTNSWWASEEFDISSIAGKGPQGANNGFSQVMVRFALQYRIPNIGMPRAGWFIDNIKVESAPDEVYAPEIVWNYPLGQRPEGELYTASSMLQFKLKDPKKNNTGVLAAQVTKRTNGGPWQTSYATLTNPGCSDSTQATASISCAVGDTVDYYITATDCATPGNTSRSPLSPGSYFSFWRVSAPPAHCGTSTGNSVPFVVAQFPYTEDFNTAGWVAGSDTGSGTTPYRGVFPSDNPPSGRNHLVNPIQSSVGYAWSVRQGRTPTMSTGPLAGYSGGTDKYLYTEASQTGASTTYTTPCIRLTNTYHPAVEFYYHKYGAGMGSLRVDIDTGNGFVAGQYVLGAAVISGETHTSYADAWNSLRINLEPYIGRFVRLRFVGIRANGVNSDLGDMAIDNLLLYEQPATDVSAVAITEPIQTLNYTSTTTVKVNVLNRGYTLPAMLPVAVRASNVTTGQIALVRDTVPVTWTAGGLAQATVNGALNLSALGTYEIKAWTELAGDAYAPNDTAPPITIVHQLPLTLPFHESFDGPAWVPGTHVGGTLASPLSTNRALSQDGFETYSFYVGRDRTSSHPTGPRWSFGRRGSFVYAKGGDPGSPSLNTNTDAVLATQTIDLSAATQPVVSFWYHMAGGGSTALTVDVYNYTTQQWVSLTNFAVLSNQQMSPVDDWRFHIVPLTAYAGSTVRIRLRATRTAGAPESDVAIDELSIYDRPTFDVAVTDITQPGPVFNLASPPNLQCEIRNIGRQSVFNVPVVLTVTSRCGTVAPFTTTQVANAIAVGNTFTITVSGSQIPYSAGDLEITARVALGTDGFAYNDTLKSWSVGVAPLTVPFGPITFDSCSANDRSFYAVTQGLRMWEMGSSSLGIPAASGTNAWHSRRTQLLGSVAEYLRMPPLIGLDTTYGAELRFKHQFAFGTSVAGNLQYYNGSSWVTLGALNDGSVNGYGSTYGTAYSTLLSSPAWFGTTGGAYITSSIPIPDGTSTSGPMQIRFQLSPTTSSSFWAIDDIEVVVPPQYSVSLLEMLANPATLKPGDSTQLNVKLYNDGRRPANSVTLTTNGVSSVVNLVPPLPVGGIRWVSVPNWVQVNSLGTQTFCTSVSLVNNRLDKIHVGDTVCTDVFVQNPIAVNASSPYCQDFESTSWSTVSINVGTDWVRGAPNQGLLATAYNGSKAYATSPGANYGPNASAFLVSPQFNVDTSATYALSFAHNMQAESAVDGGHVEYSFDGINWFPLGYTQVPGSVNWCTEPSIAALNGQSGWSRFWVGYQISSLRFKSSQPAIRFRWSFASSNLVDAPGWTVDQVCVQADLTSGPLLNLTGQQAVFSTGCP